jgi:hypothetical protein
LSEDCLLSIPYNTSLYQRTTFNPRASAFNESCLRTRAIILAFSLFSLVASKIPEQTYESQEASVPKMVAPPKDAHERMLSPIFLQAIKAGTFEIRFLKKIDVQICLSEKEVAALCFLNTESKMDYHGFRATYELSVKWTEALYSHYWSVATREENGIVFSK